MTDPKFADIQVKISECEDEIAIAETDEDHDRVDDLRCRLADLNCDLKELVETNQPKQRQRRRNMRSK
jgi:hypothetical protein